MTKDAATLEVLRGFGCDRAQGYFIGRPMPAEAFRFREGGMRNVAIPGPASLAVGALGAH